MLSKNINVIVLSLLLSGFACLGVRQAWATEVIFPESGLGPEQLGLVVNERDPLSVEIAAYYQYRRGIPEANIIRLSFDAGKSVMKPEQFALLKHQLDKQTPRAVQAYALAWTAPYRVGCMSMTSAISMGFDQRFCAKGCKMTARSSYADSWSRKPYDDYGIRPSMMLAAQNIKQAEQLIDRGVAADGSWAEYGASAQALLVETPDVRRSVRARGFAEVQQQLGGRMNVLHIKSRHLKNKDRLAFYFTGDARVENIESNNFLPGALADHLTSGGGRLTDSTQMSALRWLEGGATGSYGAVIEPCNFRQKFPDPLLAMTEYMRGATLIEAYWKSVVMPGQGLFIGEPLARPYNSYKIIESGNKLLLQSPQLSPGVYSVEAADTRDGPWRQLVTDVEVRRYRAEIALPRPASPFYRVLAVQIIGKPAAFF